VTPGDELATTPGPRSEEAGRGERIEEIRRSFANVGYLLLGPINPGRDTATRARAGWVAPYGRAAQPAAITAAGYGATAVEAAEDAWMQFETEVGSPPATSE
jgi:hypothetical protein